MKNKINYSVQAVIFDMDGVITNTMPYHYRAWKNAMLTAGIRLSKHEIYSREGKTGVLSIKEILTEKTGYYDDALGEKILRLKERKLKEILKIRFIIGARQLIKTLHKKGFQLALVTGTAGHEVQKILPAHIAELFNVIVTANDITQGKPNPEPYLLALKKLHISSQQAVVIENAPFGIQSAKAAGLSCLAIASSLKKEYLSDADYLFDSIKDLNKHINFQYTNISR